MTRSENELQFGQALKEARLIKGMSQEELALESELDRTYVSMLERGVKNPTLGTISKLARSLGMTPLQLVKRSEQLSSGELTSKSVKRNSLRPPFFGTPISCGRPINEQFEIEKELSLDEEMIKNPADTFFIKANGDSMAPTIWDGDLLIVSLKKRPTNGDVVVAQVEDEFTVKRFFKTTKGIKLIPDNTHYKEITVSELTQGLICGVVTGLARFIQRNL